MSTFKLNVLSILMLVFCLTSFNATYANTLPVPVNPEVLSVDIQQVENTSSMGGVSLFVFPANTSNITGGTPVRVFARANSGNLQKLSIMVNGASIASTTSGKLVGSFTPTVAGTYVISARALYENGYGAISGPIEIVVQ